MKKKQKQKKEEQKKKKHKEQELMTPSAGAVTASDPLQQRKNRLR